MVQVLELLQDGELWSQWRMRKGALLRLCAEDAVTANGGESLNSVVRLLDACAAAGLLVIYVFLSNLHSAVKNTIQTKRCRNSLHLSWWQTRPVYWPTVSIDSAPSVVTNASSTPRN